MNLGHTKSGSSAIFNKDKLVQHGVILGSTGSGKTGLGIALMEQLTLEGVPIIAIDPKGDIGNFYNVDMKTGDREAHAKLKAADVTIYTPGVGSEVPVGYGGVPLSIRGNGNLEEYVRQLLTLAYREPVVETDERYVYLFKVFRMLRYGEFVGISDELVYNVLNPGFCQVGALELDSYFSENKRIEMARNLTSLSASESFKRWVEGRLLNVGELLTNRMTGKARVSIISLAHLSDAERQWYLPMLLAEIVAEVRQWKGSKSLKAVLYVDECYGMLPPVANPPTKVHLMTLLKQARAYGLGVVLATQNPGDLDYRALSNVGSWWVGRLQTDRDRDKVAQAVRCAEGGVDLTAKIGDLKGREFIQAVSGTEPVVIKSKDVCCRLDGPMTLYQIGDAMAWREGVSVEFRPEEKMTTVLTRLNVAACKAAFKSMEEELKELRKLFMRAPNKRQKKWEVDRSTGVLLWRNVYRPIIRARMQAIKFDALLAWHESASRAANQETINV